MNTLKSTTTADFLREDGRKNWIDAQIRGDKFTTFVWRGKNSWEDYNCFITSDKKGLTWSNYGSIKNDYSSTMFGVNKTLLGTTVENKSITMNLCLYDVTMAQYEEFLVWLNPQILGRLYIGMKPATDYKNNWFYKAKVGSIGDSTINYLGQDKYIIELKVVFETQDNYAYREDRVYADINGVWELECSNFRSSFNIIVNDAQPVSYIIRAALKWITKRKTTTTTTTVATTTTTVDGVSTTLKGEPIVVVSEPIITIINTTPVGKTEDIVNIRLTQDLEQGINFEYSSAEGLLYKTDTQEPLSLLTSNVGQRILESMLVFKKFIPSILEDGAIKTITKEKSNPRITESGPEITETGSVTTKTTEIDDIETIMGHALEITVQNIGEDGSEISLGANSNNSKVMIYRQDKCLIPMGEILTNPTQGGAN